MMDSTMESRLIRLKRMRRVCSLREEKTVRCYKTIDNLRKEKRLNIVNSFRGLDFEWFYVDLKDDLDWNISITPSKSVQQLVNYIIGSMSTGISEKIAKNYIEEAKKLLEDNGDKCQELTRVEFFQRLSAIVANPKISSPLKVSILELIESIMLCMDININIVLNSQIILSLMISFDTFDIELITKTVNVMKIITNVSNDILKIALENGYLLFLMRIIESIRMTKQRKNNSYRQTINDLKLDLIRAISQSLLSLALHLVNTDVIINLYPLFKKLIQFKDRNVIANVLTALTFITASNPEYMKHIDYELIESITDLMSRSEENIILSAIQIWSNLITYESEYTNLVMQIKLMPNLHNLLEISESHRVIKEIANLLSIFIDKFSFGVSLLFESEIIPLLIKALISVEYFAKQQLLSTIIKIIVCAKTSDHLIYLLKSGIIEALPPLLEFEETNLTIASLEAYSCILSIAQKLGQINEVVFIGYWSYIYEWCDYFERHSNPCISGKASYIKTNFITPEHLKIGESINI